MTRDQRRAIRQSILKRRTKYFNASTNPQRMIKTPKPCSCHLCKRYDDCKRKTQEQADLNWKEQLCLT